MYNSMKTMAKLEKQSPGDANKQSPQTFSNDYAAAALLAFNLAASQAGTNKTQGPGQANPQQQFGHAVTHTGDGANMIQGSYLVYNNLANPQGNPATQAQGKLETVYPSEQANTLAALTVQQHLQQLMAQNYLNAQAANQANAAQGQNPAILLLNQNPSKIHAANNMAYQFIQNQVALSQLPNNQYMQGLPSNIAMMNAQQVVPQPSNMRFHDSLKSMAAIGQKRSLNTSMASKSNKKAKSGGTSSKTSASKIWKPDGSVHNSKSKAKRNNGKPRTSGKICQIENCTKLARSTTLFCAAHGGGRRCQHPLCTKSARGATNFCIAHGGGRRCRHPECTKSAQGSTFFCIAHGGGRRCKFSNCEKSARGPTGFCKAHGGGKRCQEKGCYKCAADNSAFCRSHGGIKRCPFKSCDEILRPDQVMCAHHRSLKEKAKLEAEKKRVVAAAGAALIDETKRKLGSLTKSEGRVLGINQDISKATAVNGNSKLLRFNNSIAKDNVVPFSVINLKTAKAGVPPNKSTASNKVDAPPSNNTAVI